MHTRHVLVLALFLAVVVGCAGNKSQDSISGVNRSEADELNAGHSRFDTAKDPPLTAHTRFAAGQFAESQNATLPAIAQYREAVKLDPKHPGALFRLGVLYAQIKDYPNAIDAWKRYIRATNDSATGYGNLGFCYELAGKPIDAENAYKSGIARNATDSTCRVNYGLMLARLDRTNEAIVQLQAVLSPAEVHYNLASVYEQQNKPQQARAEYQKALELDPQLNDARQRLAGLDSEP